MLIVGEQACAAALRAEFLARSPGLPVTVGTMLGLDRRLASPGDLDVADETALRELIESGRFRTIVGDPLFAGLIPPDGGVELVELPHPALSSKLYWDHAPHWLGAEMDRLVEAVLSKSKGV